MEKLNYLEPGDTIGIAAPAGHFSLDRFNAGLKVVKAWGFEIFIPEGLYDKFGYFAGDEAHRTRILHQLFENPRVKAILCARGGFGAMKLLSNLDYDLIKNHAKLFFGFSDITVLLGTISARSQFMTFHGPVVTSLSSSCDQTKKSMLDTLSGNIKGGRQFTFTRIIQPGYADGNLYGGNLTTLCHLIGTPFQPQFDRHILFLEDVNEKLYRIDRMLTQMRMADFFDGVKGIVLGSFHNCDPIDQVHDVFQKNLHELRIPIMAGGQFGHGQTNLIVPVGIFCQLDTQTQTLTYSI